jgi:hypothetical protein
MAFSTPAGSSNGIELITNCESSCTSSKSSPCPDLLASSTDESPVFPVAVVASKSSNEFPLSIYHPKLSQIYFTPNPGLRVSGWTPINLPRQPSFAPSSPTKRSIDVGRVGKSCGDGYDESDENESVESDSISGDSSSKDFESKEEVEFLTERKTDYIEEVTITETTQTPKRPRIDSLTTSPNFLRMSSTMIHTAALRATAPITTCNKLIGHCSFAPKKYAPTLDQLGNQKGNVCDIDVRSHRSDPAEQRRSLMTGGRGIDAQDTENKLITTLPVRTIWAKNTERLREEQNTMARNEEVGILGDDEFEN